MNGVILKIQLPYMSNAKNPVALAYNEDKSIFFQMKITDEVIAKFGDDMKGYFKCEMLEESCRILERVQEQEW